MEIINHFKSLWSILRNKENNGKKRFFAFCEMIVAPISFITIFILLPISAIFHCIPKWIITILLSAAVGYITNWIAIKMLFEPYNSEDKHWLKYITLGFWKRGLIPENKSKIADEAGKEIEKRLIKPQELSDEICKMVMTYIQEPQTINKFQNWIKDILNSNKEKIINFTISKIREYVINYIPKIITQKRINKIIRVYILPFIYNDKNKHIISKKIIDILEKRVPDFMDMIRKELAKIIVEFFEEDDLFKGGAIKAGIRFLGSLVASPETISEKLIEFIDWKDVQEKIYDKLGEQNTQKIIEEEMISMSDDILNWLNSDKAGDILEKFLVNIHQKLGIVFDKYSDKVISSTFEKIVNSEKLWNWLEKDLLESAKPKIKDFILKEGKDKLLQKLNISERVKNAVDKQDVKEFHEMINRLTAEHLGAIQVLGYILGFIIGLFQLI